jgi:hypothetical protein
MIDIFGRIKAIFDRIGAPAGASIAADVAAVKGETAGITTTNTNLGSAAGDTLTNLVAKLGNDTATVKARFDTLDAAVGTTAAGQTQVKTKTIDAHLGTTVDICIGSAQDVIVDSVVFTCVDALSADGGTFTGISIQDNDTTVHTFISQGSGIKANLTAYAQLYWTGAVKVRVGKKIQLTNYVAVPVANPANCYVEITYHAATSGGTLTDVPA